MNTLQQYPNVIKKAKKVFIQKKALYGDSWVIMDIHYIADRMMVKCERITQLLSGQAQKVDEGIPTELTDLVNYAIISLIQLKCSSQSTPMTSLTDQAIQELYDTCAKEIHGIFLRKNHDYNDAWRKMRYSSLITQMKVKLARVLNQPASQIAANPESAKDQFQDIVNYAVFAQLHPDAPNQ